MRTFSLPNSEILRAMVDEEEYSFAYDYNNFMSKAKQIPLLIQINPSGFAGSKSKDKLGTRPSLNST